MVSVYFPPALRLFQTATAVNDKNKNEHYLKCRSMHCFTMAIKLLWGKFKFEIFIMLLLIIALVLIALAGYAIYRHFKSRRNNRLDIRRNRKH
jgi:hypothetical protein